MYTKRSITNLDKKKKQQNKQQKTQHTDVTWRIWCICNNL